MDGEWLGEDWLGKVWADGEERLRKDLGESCLKKLIILTMERTKGCYGDLGTSVHLRRNISGETGPWPAWVSRVPGTHTLTPESLADVQRPASLTHHLQVYDSLLDVSHVWSLQLCLMFSGGFPGYLFWKICINIHNLGIALISSVVWLAYFHWLVS